MPVRQVRVPECIGCGACCRNWVVAVDDSDFEDHGTPLALTTVEAGSADQQRVMRQTPGGACIALDEGTKSCSIYAQRPQVCRDFARLSRECWDKLREEGMLETAP